MNEKQVQKALDYIILNPGLSFHHVAVKFDVFVGDLQNAYTKYQQEKRKCATKSYRIKYEEKNDRVRVLEDELHDFKMSGTCLFRIPELDK